MKIIDCEQGSPEWHAVRAGKATASVFDKILSKGKGNAEAVGRRNLRAKLVVERLSERCIESTFESYATRQGQEREPAGREAFEARTGLLVEQVGFCLDDSGLYGSSPDGLIGDAGGLELKCPELSAHIEYLQRDDEPTEYRAQIQGNLWITGRKWWYFVSFNPDFPPHLQLVIRKVYRDEAYIAQLKLAVMLFMSEVKVDEAALRALPRMDEVAV